VNISDRPGFGRTVVGVMILVCGGLLAGCQYLVREAINPNHEFFVDDLFLSPDVYESEVVDMSEARRLIVMRLAVDDDLYSSSNLYLYSPYEYITSQANLTKYAEANGDFLILEYEFGDDFPSAKIVEKKDKDGKTHSSIESEPRYDLELKFYRASDGRLLFHCFDRQDEEEDPKYTLINPALNAVMDWMASCGYGR